METQKKGNQISNYFEKTDDHLVYEIAFRRWLVYEIETKRMTVVEASKTFNISDSLLCHWRKKYALDFIIPLQDMTAEEKQKMDLLEKRLKEAEKKLEEACINNIALNMLIDVAEEKLKINIRKKSGAKQ